MKILVLLLLVLSSFLSATTITLNNNIKIAGEVISVDKDYLYVTKDNVLFIIEKKIFATADQESAEQYLKLLEKQRFHRINYNSYSEIVEIDHRNQYKTSTYTQILKYCSDLNPVSPPFEPPTDPAINKHHYVTIKPLRLLVKWTDASYGYRFTKYNLEWRISASYLPEYQPEESEFYSNLSDLKTVSTSLRYYMGEHCTGLFSGIGYSQANLTVQDLSYFFGFIKSEDRARVDIKGLIFEAGVTNTVGSHMIITWSAAALAANATYECLNRDKDGQRLLFIPSANFTVGMLF
ncbi:MAG: hypothetical protein ABIK30_05535 [bacterium]